MFGSIASVEDRRRIPPAFTLTVLAVALWFLLVSASSSAIRQPAVAAQPGGKVLVTVERKSGIVVARLRRDGRLDRDFGRRGFATIGDRGARYTSGMVIGPTGQIDVAGRFRGVSRPVEFVAQLHKDGELDRSFGGDGISQPLADRGVIEMGGLAGSPDGHLLVGAAADTAGCLGAGPSCEHFELVASMTPNGELDPSFSGDGVAEIPLYGTNVELAVAPDGRIVAGALFNTPTMTPDGAPISHVSRLLADGSLDPSFGGGSGSVDLRTPMSGVALSETGEIYAGGAAEGWFGAGALGGDGSLDEGFGSGGLFATQIGEVTGGTGSLLREANGDLLIAGPVATSCRPRNPVAPDLSRCRLSARIVRLDATGNLDAGFGRDGVASIAISQSRKIFDPAAGVQLIESRDGLRLATPIFNGPATDLLIPDDPTAIAVAALRSDGSLDRRYGHDGLALVRNEGG